MQFLVLCKNHKLYRLVAKWFKSVTSIKNTLNISDLSFFSGKHLQDVKGGFGPDCGSEHSYLFRGAGQAAQLRGRRLHFYNLNKEQKFNGPSRQARKKPTKVTMV